MSMDLSPSELEKLEKKPDQDPVPSIETIERYNRLVDLCNRVNEKTGSHFIVTRIRKAKEGRFELEGIPEKITRNKFSRMTGNYDQIRLLLQRWGNEWKRGSMTVLEGGSENK